MLIILEMQTDSCFQKTRFFLLMTVKKRQGWRRQVTLDERGFPRTIWKPKALGVRLRSEREDLMLSTLLQLLPFPQLLLLGQNHAPHIFIFLSLSHPYPWPQNLTVWAYHGHHWRNSCWCILFHDEVVDLFYIDLAKMLTSKCGLFRLWKIRYCKCQTFIYWF